MEVSELRDNNPWWEDPSAIQEDIKIQELEEAEYEWSPRLIHKIELEEDAIHTLRGPRQVGKTTMVKDIIRSKLEEIEGSESERIFYYNCDLIDTREEIAELLETYVDWARKTFNDRLYIFLDEVSSIEEWQDGVKNVIEKGKLKDTTLVLTGSHALDIKQGGEMLPGRKGEGKNNILMPMKFAEYIDLVTDFEPPTDLEKRKETIFNIFKGKETTELTKMQPYIDELNSHLIDYMITGGYPLAINQFHTEGEIDYKSYELLREIALGELYKRGKKESYLRDLLERIIETRTTPVGKNTLKKNNSIRDTDTVKDYLRLLKESFLVNEFHKADINKKRPKTQSYSKIYFSDPFIYHSFKSWIKGHNNPFKESRKETEKAEETSKLAEQIVGNHMIRLAYNLNPSSTFNAENHVFYWRKNKEVDFLLKKDGELYPFEVGYKNQINDKGQWIRKRLGYPVILSKDQFEINDEYAIIPVALLLYFI